jgi:hypothetical protein
MVFISLLFKRGFSLIEEPSKSKIGGVFPVRNRMKLVSGHIRGDFPVMQSNPRPFSSFSSQ